MSAWKLAVIIIMWLIGMLLSLDLSPVTVPGDDTMDGIVMEDESGWDCRTMGNRICG